MAHMLQGAMSYLVGAAGASAWQGVTSVLHDVLQAQIPVPEAMTLRCCQRCQHLQGRHCMADNAPVCLSVCLSVWRDSSLTARYVQGKPHPRLKAFGTIVGFSSTRG